MASKASGANKTSKTGKTTAKAATVKAPVKTAAKTPAKAKATVKASAKARPAAKPVAKSASKPARKLPARTAPKAAKPAVKRRAASVENSNVLSELKGLARELKEAAKGLNKKSGQNPKHVSSILGSVERMTADAANKSLGEAEAAKLHVTEALDSLAKNWSRQDLESRLKVISGHLTNIIVAQEFQDLAGQSLRKAMKALVGAIIVVEGGGLVEDKRLTQAEIDGMLKELMP